MRQIECLRRQAKMQRARGRDFQPVIEDTERNGAAADAVVAVAKRIR